MTIPSLLLVLSLAAAGPRAAEPAPPPSGFDLSALDRTAKPCDDFYQYACGTWMKKNPIPADQSRWGRFGELADRNKGILRELLESAVADPGDASDHRIGNLYGACMDEDKAERAGAEPVKPLLDQVAALDSAAGLAPLLARLHRAGVDAGFGYGSEIDAKDADSVIAAVDQGGLGLPDRDYYLKDDAKTVETRAAYQAHAARILGLLGGDAKAVESGVAALMRVETALAKASMDRTLRREPANVYHKTDKAGLAKLAPAFDWERYFAEAGGPAWDAVNDASPDFMAGFSALLSSAPLSDLKAYLRWRTASRAAPWLSKAFAEENFDFYGRRLTGAKELKPRWKRCVELTDHLLGEDLGRRYVAKAYPPEAKARMDALVAAVEAALKDDMSGLDWMTPATKAKAMGKLAAIRNKVGYPEKWRDYSTVTINRGDLTASIRAATAFEFGRQLGKIGRPVDRGEWMMSPPTVNAYYDPHMNDINFPAGILQPPFFDKTMDDAVNLGAIGVVIGHELTHGFDDEGRHFDAKGNLEDWWSPEDAKAFEGRAACVADQYSGYEALAGVRLNGKLTLGENTADNGGLRVAGMALRAGPAQAARDGFTPEQRLFLGFAQVWCENRTDAVARMMARTNPHSPGRWRVIGSVSNMPEFATAFSCKAGDRMLSAKPCRVW